MEHSNGRTGEQENRGERAYSYRNLDVWKRAQRLTVEIVRLTASFPRSPAADILARQIIRSSSSIGANIAEGHARFSLGAFRNHLQIARGSTGETDNFLALLLELKMIDGGTEARLHAECDGLMGALTNRINSLEQRGTKRVGEDAATYHTSDDAAD